MSKRIAKEQGTDKKYWRFHHPKGAYTVSSGYRLGAKIKQEVSMRNSPGCSKVDNLWWSKLWSLHIPPKLKIFRWQIACNILPTEGNLMLHHVPISPHCRLCGFFNASAIHAIFLCSMVRKIWNEMDLHLPMGMDSGMNPVDFIEEILYHNRHVSVELILAVACGIWKKVRQHPWGSTFSER